MAQSQTLAVSQKHNVSNLSTRSATVSEVDEKVDGKEKSVPSFKFKDETEKSVALDWLSKEDLVYLARTSEYFLYFYIMKGGQGLWAHGT